VFNVEPLPSESKLWSHPKVTSTKHWFSKTKLIHVFSVTPHVAGESRAQDIAECFVRNLNKFDSGENLDCVVNWDRLY
jgi:phosphoglycerate dehydrogenase-like enzyme